MNVNRITEQTNYQKITNTANVKGKQKANRAAGGDFYESLSENLYGQAADPEENEVVGIAKQGDVVAQQETASATARSTIINTSYQYHSVTSSIKLQQNGMVNARAVVECGARNISYAESDYVKTYVEQGFAFKAKVDITGHYIYVEQKYEDGTVKGYDVDYDKLSEDTQNPIEQMALEAWEMAKRAMMGENVFREIKPEEMISDGTESEEEKDITDMTVEEALAEFYEFIQDRIKNGPPKYLIGSQEYSVEEWEKLLEGVDGQLEDIREELREWIEQMKEEDKEAELEKDSEEDLENVTEVQIRSLLEDRIAANNGVPYSHLAKDGIIEYNGVTFVCDEKHKAICLGDVSNMSNCLRIPLSEGGCLIVNRENLGDLSKAISMFSPEDVNLIMRAIAQDAKVQQMKNELEDDSEVINLAEE